MKGGSSAEECDLFLNQWLVLALRSSKVNASRRKSAPHNPCRNRSTDITDEGARLIAIIPSGLISCPSGCLTIVVIQQSPNRWRRWIAPLLQAQDCSSTISRLPNPW